VSAHPDLPAYVDVRGTLVPIELDAVGFDVRRVFAVAGAGSTTHRGNHALTCRELVVLVAGRVTVEVSDGENGPFARHELNEPGRSVAAGPHGWLRYTLHGERSVVLVLADGPYVPEREEAS
jgi:hypothetical protein